MNSSRLRVAFISVVEVAALLVRREIDAQPEGDSVDEVEIADDQGQVEDVLVGEFSCLVFAEKPAAILEVNEISSSSSALGGGLKRINVDTFQLLNGVVKPRGGRIFS